MTLCAMFFFNFFFTTILGVDFDLLKTHYLFDNETSEQRVLIAVYDDLILEAEEQFFLYFPTLSTNDGVLLIAETTPNRVTVTLKDDEGNAIYRPEAAEGNSVWVYRGRKPVIDK